MTTNTPELKSCPFCGGEAEHYQPNEDIAVISCTQCNAESGYYDGEDSTTPDDAIKFWNHRAGETTWQSIESAPDGKNVLITIPLEGGGFFEPVIAYRNGKYWYSEFRGKLFSIVGIPSHWKPLDLPPTGENK